MSVSYQIMSPWDAPPAAFITQLKHAVDVGLGRAKEASLDARVFFRADDVSTPAGGFSRLADLFLRNRIPLCAAVVPAWLQQAHAKELKQLFHSSPELCFWHQHGWRHQNHQTLGKKSEFGNERQEHNKIADIVKGREKIERYFGPQAARFFTPPWNRIDMETIQGLVKEDYLALSRSVGAKPLPPLPIPDIPINADLHTRKAPSSDQAAQDILHEIENGLASGLLGIMIHHQRMNDAAFDFLDDLLKIFSTQKHIHRVTLDDLLAHNEKKLQTREEEG